MKKTETRAALFSSSTWAMRERRAAGVKRLLLNIAQYFSGAHGGLVESEQRCLFRRRSFKLERRPKSFVTNIWRRLRHESLPVVSVAQGDKPLVGNDVQHHALAPPEQAGHVHLRSDALAVPDHQPDRCLLGHSVILHGVIVEAPASSRCRHRPDRPVTDIVSAVTTGTEDINLVVAPAAEIRLNRLVGAIGIAHEDGEALLDDLVDTALHVGIEAGDPSRPPDEHLSHDR